MSGLQVSARISGGARRFTAGEHVPLEIVVHNPGERDRTLWHLGGWWWTGPSMEVTRGEQPVRVQETVLLGGTPIFHRDLKPGETVVLKHPGLWLGQPERRHRSDPHLLDPVPGKYRIRMVFPTVDGASSRPAKVENFVELEVAAR